MIVDAEPVTRKMLEHLLKKNGYVCTLASNTEEAREYLKKEDFHLIISDVNMPGESGLDFVQYILSEYKEVAAIIITGMYDPEIANKALKIGVWGFITKPLDYNQVLISVANALHRRKLEIDNRTYRENLEQMVVKRTKEFYEARKEIIKKHKELQRLFRQVEIVKKEWESSMDCMGDMVILIDNKGKIKRCNKAVKEFLEKPYNKIVGKDWKKLLLEEKLNVVASYDWGEELFHRQSGRWFILNFYPFKYNDDHEFSGSIIVIHDTTKLKQITQELERKNKEIEKNRRNLEKAYSELKETQAKILHQEKLASIGQLAAGIAHEINNPIGFISSNLSTLNKYVERLTDFIHYQSDVIEKFKEKEIVEKLKERRKTLKLDYITGDIKDLIKESIEGANRVKRIVQDLKSFSRVDEAEYKHADINECIESTINIVWNELKYKATLRKEYGNISCIKCYHQQLNQVFMNLLVNAVHAIEKQGEIFIKTWQDDNSIFISIKDTGHGIPKKNLNRIFEPFFTTKDVGKGTGLGLSITYDIIKKHNGEISVQSEVGKGTEFIISLPIVDGR